MPRHPKFIGHRRRRAFSRNAAASKISRAWRARRRRRTGLLARTALANRRTIRRMNKAVETKVLQMTQATPAQQFAGQFQDSVVVDNTGQDVAAAIPFAGDLLYCAQGAGQDQRVGAWIQLKSLTMHYAITCQGPTQDAWYELFVVLDRDPLQGASLTGSQGVLFLESATPAPPNKLALAFQNLGETGSKHNRFKILARRKHRLSNFLNIGTSVPPISTAPATSGGTTYGNVTRAVYTPAVASQMPRSFPQYVQGSINLKLRHKINYGPDTSTQPSNQTIRIMAFQCNPAGIAQPRCMLQYYTRVRFKDE